VLVIHSVTAAANILLLLPTGTAASMVNTVYAKRIPTRLILQRQAAGTRERGRRNLNRQRHPNRLRQENQHRQQNRQRRGKGGRFTRHTHKILYFLCLLGTRHISYFLQTGRDYLTLWHLRLGFHYLLTYSIVQSPS